MATSWSSLPPGGWNRWEGEDSNLRRLRRRFYRPLPWAARRPSRKHGKDSKATDAAGRPTRPAASGSEAQSDMSWMRCEELSNTTLSPKPAGGGVPDPKPRGAQPERDHPVRVDLPRPGDRTTRNARDCRPIPGSRDPHAVSQLPEHALRVDDRALIAGHDPRDRRHPRIDVDRHGKGELARRDQSDVVDLVDRQRERPAAILSIPATPGDHDEVGLLRQRSNSHAEAEPAPM